VTIICTECESDPFVHDQLANGRRFRVLTIIDDVTRECLAAVPDTSLSGKRVVREINALIARRDRPGAIVSDNGTEFTSSAVLAFTQAAKLDWRYHRAGQADENAFAESFQGRMRTNASTSISSSRSPRPRHRRRLGRRLQHVETAVRNFATVAA
jgi:transposase InsO family protein